MAIHTCIKYAWKSDILSTYIISCHTSHHITSIEQHFFGFHFHILYEMRWACRFSPYLTFAARSSNLVKLMENRFHLKKHKQCPPHPHTINGCWKRHKNVTFMMIIGNLVIYRCQLFFHIMHDKRNDHFISIYDAVNCQLPNSKS